MPIDFPELPCFSPRNGSTPFWILWFPILDGELYYGKGISSWFAFSQLRHPSRGISPRWLRLSEINKERQWETRWTRLRNGKCFNRGLQAYSQRIEGFVASDELIDRIVHSSNPDPKLQQEKKEQKEEKPRQEFVRPMKIISVSSIQSFSKAYVFE